MKWHVVHTRPRWEKKVHNSLIEKGIESFCPLNKISRKWSDRMKVVEEPLFKSYVFVKICDNDRTNVRMTAGVMNFAKLNGKPSIIKEKQIQAIKQFLHSYEYLEVVKTDLSLICKENVSECADVIAHNQYFTNKKKINLIIGGFDFVLNAGNDKKSLSLLQ
jgi:transcription antitermination factor NusG